MSRRGGGLDRDMSVEEGDLVMKRVLTTLFVGLLLVFSFVSVNTVAAQTTTDAQATPVDDVDATPTDEDVDATPTDEDEDTDTDTGEETDTGTGEETDTGTGEETGTDGTGGTSAQALPNTGAGAEQGVGGMSAWLIAALLLVASIGVAIPFRLRRNA